MTTTPQHARIPFRWQLSAEDFARLAERTKLCSRTRAAARTVLVEVRSVTQSARIHGIKHVEQVSRAVASLRREALKEQTTCAACGRPLAEQRHLQPHHEGDQQPTQPAPAAAP